MTRMQYLTAAYREMAQRRDRKLLEIKELTGDPNWMLRNHIPGNAVQLVASWLGYCRMLAKIGADIEHERRQPTPGDMVLQ